ncbi:hypothetical protein, partial [Sporisorium scitamineum]
MPPTLPPVVEDARSNPMGQKPDKKKKTTIEKALNSSNIPSTLDIMRKNVTAQRDKLTKSLAISGGHRNATEPSTDDTSMSADTRVTEEDADMEEAKSPDDDPPSESQASPTSSLPAVSQSTPQQPLTSQPLVSQPHASQPLVSQPLVSHLHASANLTPLPVVTSQPAFTSQPLNPQHSAPDSHQTSQ